MHTLRPKAVNRVRAVVLWLLRAVAAMMIFFGAVMVIRRLIFGIATHQLNAAWMIFDGSGERHEFSLGLALVIMGVVLAFLASILARWIVSLPPEDCPRCLYAGITAGMDRCPECGLTGFAPRPPPPPPSPPAPGS